MYLIKSVKIFTLVLMILRDIENLMKTEEQHVYDAVALFFKDVETPTLTEELELIEKTRIKNALDCNNGNRSRAAKQLGIGRTLLIHKIKKYQLNG